MNLYQIKDTFLAATLQCKGYPPDRIDKIGKEFHFGYTQTSTENIKSLVDLYWSHTLTVDPLLLFTAFKELKGRINSL